MYMSCSCYSLLLWICDTAFSRLLVVSTDVLWELLTCLHKHESLCLLWCVVCLSDWLSEPDDHSPSSQRNNPTMKALCYRQSCCEIPENQHSGPNSTAISHDSVAGYSTSTTFCSTDDDVTGYCASFSLSSFLTRLLRIFWLDWNQMNI